jgi:hypothetical protein
MGEGKKDGLPPFDRAQDGRGGAARNDGDDAPRPFGEAQESLRSGRAEEVKAGSGPSTGSGWSEAEGGDGIERIQPNRNRVLQVARTGNRKLFDDARKEIFLQWFAATANLSFSAEQAGVCRQTISKHRFSDPAFAERYMEALSLAVPDLQARLLAYLSGRPVLNVVGDLEPPDDAVFDPHLAIQILRELSRILRDAKPGGPLKQGRSPRVATNEEVKEALLKALVALGIRENTSEEPPRAGEGI